MPLVEELWRLHAAKRSKTPPDEKHKKKLAEKHSKTPPDEKHKKKLAAKHSKTPLDVKHKQKQSVENRFKKPVDIDRRN